MSQTHSILHLSYGSSKQHSFETVEAVPFYEVIDVFGAYLSLFLGVSAISGVELLEALLLLLLSLPFFLGGISMPWIRKDCVAGAGGTAQSLSTAIGKLSSQASISLSTGIPLRIPGLGTVRRWSLIGALAGAKRRQVGSGQMGWPTGPTRGVGGGEPAGSGLMGRRLTVSQ